MRKSVLLLTIALIVGTVFLLTGCGSQNTADETAKKEPKAEQKVEPKAQKAVTLKLAHQWPQDGEDYVVAAGMKFAEEVEKRTNGQVKIEMYPAQSLVKAKDTHTALKNGAIDMAIYPYIYAAGAVPELNIVLMPALWRNHDEVFAFKDSEVMKNIEEKLNKQLNFKTLSWIQISGGIASTDKAVQDIGDVEGLKWRSAGKYTEVMLKSLGGGTVSMASSEIYTALQRGLLNAVLTSSSSFGSYKLYEVADYYTSPEDYSFYFTIEPLAISMKAWDSLTEDQQQIMLEVAKEVEQEALEGAKKEDARVAKMFADAGVTVEKMTKEQWDGFAKAAEENAYPAFREEVPNGEWLLDTTLKSYGR
ncbi:TRAP transporter substrate-binding protein DctP [Metallumcola ferriviriculae]|uniref:TRAP transporter substrate-binding protein DctP n=1 Tax=Metallumcola ferriviriculae TaxID=3039180 RepID=A0AAU0UQL0_9FIRM|nr:TRAP transporter substrate-binding protein DctP [Desulfitibacteraceae bacterium MK1]